MVKRVLGDIGAHFYALVVALSPALASCGDTEKNTPAQNGIGGSSVTTGGTTGGSGSSSGSGGTMTSSAGSAGSDALGGSANGSCSGLAGERLVSELDATEIEQACHGYRSCSADELTVERYCQLLGRARAIGGEPAASDEEVRARCQAGYDECSADPAQVMEYLAATRADLLSRPCEPTGCEASINDIDVCAADTRAHAYGQLVPCAELTLAELAAGSRDPPPSCAGLALGCYHLFAIVQ